jgi:hypothetical protein
VRLEIELAEDGVKETPPLLVVGVDDVEDGRNMGFDVDRLERGWSSGRRQRWWWHSVFGNVERGGEGGDRGRRRGTAMDGVLECEDLIGVHGEQRRRRWALVTGDQDALWYHEREICINLDLVFISCLIFI